MEIRLELMNTFFFDCSKNQGGVLPAAYGWGFDDYHRIIATVYLGNTKRCCHGKDGWNVDVQSEIRIFHSDLFTRDLHWSFTGHFGNDSFFWIQFRMKMDEISMVGVSTHTSGRSEFVKAPSHFSRLGCAHVYDALLLLHVGAATRDLVWATHPMNLWRHGRSNQWRGWWFRWPQKDGHVQRDFKNHRQTWQCLSTVVVILITLQFTSFTNKIS